jgi:predicted Zn-dependent peptidase
MAFKGTKRRSAQSIAEEIEAVGGHLNAYTSRENTAYFAKVLKEDLALATDIIADILQNALLDHNELERERTVIIQEINQAHDTPDDIIFDYFQQAAYPDQAIGRSVLGTPSKIEGIERDTIKNFMMENYACDRIVLAAAGNVEHETFVALANDYFTKLPQNRPIDTETLDYVSGEFREKRQLEQLHLVVGFDGLSYDDADYYPMAVLSTLLGGGMSSRLFQEARERRGLVYSIYTFASNYQDGGLFGVYAGTGSDKIGELLPVICREITLVCNSVLENEIARAKAQLKSSTLMGLENSSSRCEQAARQIQIFGHPISKQEIINKIEAVNEDAVERVARRIFSSDPTIAAIGPTENLDNYSRIKNLLR